MSCIRVFIKDKDWLYEQYIIKMRSQQDIANELNCDISTIGNWIRKYDIGSNGPRHGKLGKKIAFYDKQLLEKLYIKNEMTIPEIAAYTNCGSTTIHRWLCEFNIPRRDSAWPKGKTGCGTPNWKGGISFLPYCEKFNEGFKEHIRELFNRTCFLCGKEELQNIVKLSVHHIDYNKNAICNGKEWAFVPLCQSCHGKTNNRHYYFNLLINYWAYKYFDWIDGATFT